MKLRRSQRGLSLIELMVASTLGLLATAAAGSLFLASARTYRQSNQATRLQDELSYAMAALAADVEMAGHWAQLHDPSRIGLHASLRIGQDCGPAGTDWAYGDLSALGVIDNAGASAAQARHQCLDGAALREGTDVISIKRVLARPATLASGTVYLRAGDLALPGGGAAGFLYLHGGAVPPVAAPFRDWRYQAAVYYVQAYTDHAGESPRVPALCRNVLGAGPTFERECLAQGIEDLQIEVGIDSDEDGAANHFVSAPSAAELSRAVAVRLYLLARSTEPDGAYRDPKTYSIGNGAVHEPQADDRRHRHRTLSSEIVLHNPRAMQGISFQ